MMVAACSTESSSKQKRASADMASRTVIWLTLRESATPRIVISRSVIMPITRSSWHTGRAPILSFLSLRAAASRDNIGALPVCQDERVIGMITDRDITMRGVADSRNVSQMTVREAMSAEALFCFEDDSVEQAATIMSQ